MTVLGVTNCLPLGYKTCSAGGVSCLVLVKKSTTGEIIDHGGEPTFVVMVTVMRSNLLLNLYVNAHRFVLFSTWVRESSFYSGW